LAALDRDQRFPRPLAAALPDRPLELDLGRRLVLAQALDGAVADDPLAGRRALLDLGDQDRVDVVGAFRPLAAEGVRLALQRAQASEQFLQAPFGEAGADLAR